LAVSLVYQDDIAARTAPEKLCRSMAGNRGWLTRAIDGGRGHPGNAGAPIHRDDHDLLIMPTPTVLILSGRAAFFDQHPRRNTAHRHRSNGPEFRQFAVWLAMNPVTLRPDRRRTVVCPQLIGPTNGPAKLVDGAWEIEQEPAALQRTLFT
jgi:hypothetical protein